MKKSMGFVALNYIAHPNALRQLPKETTYLL